MEGMNWIFKNIMEMIANMINGLLDFFGDAVTSIFEKIADANVSLPMVANASTYTTVFAFSLLIFLTMNKFFKTYVMETEGDPDKEPLDLLVRGAEVVAIISTNEWVFTTLLGFSKAFARDLSGSAEVDPLGEHTGKLVLELMLNLTNKGATFIIVLLIFVIGIIVFIFMAGIRGAELSLSKILLPIMAVDLIDSAHERWNQFFVQYMILFLGYTIQIFCFRVFCANFLLLSSASMGMDIITTVGWFVLMLKAPKWLKEFCYSSGIGNATGGVLRSIPFLLSRGKGG